jgi:hypothetical protein
LLTAAISNACSLLEAYFPPEDWICQPMSKEACTQ